MTSVAVAYNERALVLALRSGDEAAFTDLIDRYTPSLLRVASSYVRSRAVAEEVVQEAWLGVLRGIDRFEGRSSLKTWIFRVAVNVAKTRATREARSIPFSALTDEPIEAARRVPPAAVYEALGIDGRLVAERRERDRACFANGARLGNVDGDAEDPGLQ